MIEVRAKVGTGPGTYLVLRGSLWEKGGVKDEMGYPLLLEKLPVAGDRVSWIELDNGPLHTGIVEGIRGDLFVITRH